MALLFTIVNKAERVEMELNFWSTTLEIDRKVEIVRQRILNGLSVLLGFKMLVFRN